MKNISVCECIQSHRLNQAYSWPGCEVDRTEYDVCHVDANNLLKIQKVFFYD